MDLGVYGYIWWVPRFIYALEEYNTNTIENI
jgi:hypothetical protein